jgi:phosphoribosylanthranilate isomerase
MRVKICGITELEDALCAVEAGADALGFVFYENSPRYISPKKAEEIIKKLPPFVEKVGLFVECSSSFVDEVFCESKISLAQIHFDVDEEFLDAIKAPTLPVVRAKSREDIFKFEDRYRLVDAFTEAYGGSGKRLNLEWFRDYDCSKIAIAGGLTPKNLDELAGYNFFGVDVSSGVELKKGKKDCQKVKEFVKNARSL